MCFSVAPDFSAGGWSVVVDELALKYRDDGGEEARESARLTLDGFILGSGLAELFFFGEGIGLSFLSTSLSLEMPTLLGFEKSFILLFSGFCLCSLSENDGLSVFGNPGDEIALRGKAAFAALVAAA